jgi:hypothetical protein
MFVIITDGEENASREYTVSTIKSQIERQKVKYGWEFVFLGANIDAVTTASRFGIDPDRAQNYHADGEGAQIVYETIAEAAVKFRSVPRGERLDDNWNEKIRNDFHKRGGKKK